MYRYHPRHIHHHFLRNLHIPTTLCAVLLIASFLGVGTFVLASATSNFRMVINPGVLAVDMVDESFLPVASPMVDMGSKFQSVDCQSAQGTFGTLTEQIYVKNPDGADNGWVVTLSAASPAVTWSGENGEHLDFNDPITGGCIDGNDGDNVAGQMTIDPSVGVLSLGMCSRSCLYDGVVLGNAASFSEGMRDTITLLSASAGSSDTSDWVLRGVSVVQTIPGNQLSSHHYSLDLFLSVTAI